MVAHTPGRASLASVSTDSTGETAGDSSSVSFECNIRGSNSGEKGPSRAPRVRRRLAVHSIDKHLLAPRCLWNARQPDGAAKWLLRDRARESSRKKPRREKSPNPPRRPAVWDADQNPDPVNGQKRDAE